MERIILTPENMHEAVGSAKDALENDGIILYPTDTLYGLGVNAESPNALKALFDLKGRDEGKQFSVIVADIAAVYQFAKVSTTALRIMERFLPGALTVVLPRKEGIGTIGFRIPEEPFCLALARAFGKPFTATSANLSGMQTAPSAGEILEELGERANTIDVVIDIGTRSGSASTVIECDENDTRILREGVIARSELEPYFN